MYSCFHGSKVSKNLSELALSAGETSQFHPGGADVCPSRVKIAEPDGVAGGLGLEEGGPRKGDWKMEEEVGLRGLSGGNGGGELIGVITGLPPIEGTGI